MVGVPPSRNETASRGTGRKGKGREIKRFTCSTTATRGFARFGLRSRGTRFIHGERKERETEERNGKVGKGDGGSWRSRGWNCVSAIRSILAGGGVGGGGRDARDFGIGGEDRRGTAALGEPRGQ